MPVVCLYLPHLRADVALLAHPHLRGRPVVLLDGPGPEARVTGRSARAALLGVLPAMSAHAARFRAPSAVFLPDNSIRALLLLRDAADAVLEDGAGVPEVGDDFVAIHTGHCVAATRVLEASGLQRPGLTVRVGTGASVREALAAAKGDRGDAAANDYAAVRRLQAS